MMASELDWELTVLLLLEEDVYPYLEAQGVPRDMWEYYIAFARRIWERRVHFNRATFWLEKKSVVNEFTWRGLNPTHLDNIQGMAELRARQKVTREPPPHWHPSYVCWFNSCEDLDDWTLDPGVVASINTLIHQEGAGSVEFSMPAAAVEAWKPVNYCDEYFGFWVRIKDSVPAGFRFNLYAPYPTFWVRWYMHAPNFWGLAINHSLGLWSFNSGVVVNADQWYWMEYYREWIAPNWRYHFLIDGVPIVIFATGGTIGSYDRFEVMNRVVYGAWTALVDYLRFADRQEYPPL